MGNTRLSNAFKVFARDCVDSSPLYECLALEIAKDEELLELSTRTQCGQPPPNMLLGAVHHLLLNEVDDELSTFYPNIVENPKQATHSFPYFKNFCQLHREKIIDLLQKKLVQTNEVRRCTYLYPSFSHIYELSRKPLALIEIGTSAGFQLLWDKYSYSYQLGEIYGNKDSNIHLTSEIKGGNKPHLPRTSPPVTHRIGLDLHVNDVSNREDFLWLLSLIWPEHKARRERFKQAAQAVHKEDIHLIEGDGVKMLPKIAEQIPTESTICIFHTHVANQFPVELKHELLANVKQIGQSRDIFHLYNNMWDGDLHLDSFIDGKEFNQVVGEAHSHGKWFTWRIN